MNKTVITLTEMAMVVNAETAVLARKESKALCYG